MRRPGVRRKVNPPQFREPQQPELVGVRLALAVAAQLAAFGEDDEAAADTDVLACRGVQMDH